MSRGGGRALKGGALRRPGRAEDSATGAGETEASQRSVALSSDLPPGDFTVCGVDLLVC